LRESGELSRVSNRVNNIFQHQGVVLAANVPAALRWAILQSYEENVVAYSSKSAVFHVEGAHFSQLSGLILCTADGSTPLQTRWQQAGETKHGGTSLAIAGTTV
jgi:hypothetical protein